MNTNLMLVVALSLAAMSAEANIYKCEKSDGSLYYQDKFCNSDDHVQTRLNCYNKPLDKNEINNIQDDLQRYRKSISKKHRRNLKRKSIAGKKQEADKRRRLRMEARCEKVKQEIAKVTQRQRTGYNISQGEVMNRKLVDYKEQKRKYCTNE